jgi:EAL domain-containing protein (putative c-di-GMP-specific phosphodiesterase class I)
MNAPASFGSGLAGELDRAVERGELYLLFQPKVEIAGGGLCGVEALARWRHPRLGTLKPELFVPMAEHGGAIDALTEWVLKAGLRQWLGWRDQGVKTDIAFNISAISLRDIYFPDWLQRLCQTEGVPCERVTVEITEGATQHMIRLLDTLTRFRLKGMKLALDDFGTGYSSLLQLRRLPYTELKIDKCFVAEAAASRESRLIVQAAVNLAHGLGLTATAEGVQDEPTLALLADLGCDHAQGYLIARPMQGTALVPWLLEYDAVIGGEAGEMRLRRCA